jgi:hypothetical protein
MHNKINWTNIQNPTITNFWHFAPIFKKKKIVSLEWVKRGQKTSFSPIGPKLEFIGWEIPKKIVQFWKIPNNLGNVILGYFVFLNEQVLVFDLLKQKNIVFSSIDLPGEIDIKS